MTEEIQLLEPHEDLLQKVDSYGDSEEVLQPIEAELRSVYVVKDIPAYTSSGRLLSFVLRHLKNHFIKAHGKPHPFTLFATPKSKIDFPNTESAFRRAIKAQLLNLDLNGLKESSVSAEIAREVSQLVAQFFFSRSPEGNKLELIKLKKNPFFDHIALLENGSCVIQTKRLLGAGSYKKVYEGIQISIVPNGKNPSKVELTPVAVLRVAQRVYSSTNSILQAKREDALAAEFSSSHIVKPSNYSFRATGLSSREEWIMISDKFSFSLDALYKNKVTRTFVETLRALKGAAKGLAHMHSRGYIHRDIKPANIVVSNEGKGVLIDLGFIHKIGQHVDQVKGTPYYTAPEVVRNGERIGGTQTKAADVWAYGISLYQMCHPSNKRPPFLKSGQSPDEVYKALDKIKKMDPEEYKKMLFSGWQAQNSVEQQLQELIQKLLSIDPIKRGTADELYASLKTIYQKTIKK